MSSNWRTMRSMGERSEDGTGVEDGDGDAPVVSPVPASDPANVRGAVSLGTIGVHRPFAALCRGAGRFGRYRATTLSLLRLASRPLLAPCLRPGVLTVRPYLELLRRPAVMPVVIGHVFGRLTPGMILLAIILALRAGGYGYAAVGLVTGAHQLGVALGSPLQGRAADVFGHRRVLLPDGLVYLGGTSLIAFGITQRWTLGPLVAITVVTGLASPPITACARAVFGAMFRPGREREQAFVITVANVEFGFLVGPLLTVALAALFGPTAAVIGAGVAVAVGSLVYGLGARIPETGPRPRSVGALRTDGGAAGEPRSGGSLGRVWSSPGLRAMVVVYLGIATTFGAFDLFAASVAEQAGRPSAAGTLISIIAFASLLGGFAYGARIWPESLRRRMQRFTGLFILVLLMFPLVAGQLVLVAVVAFAAGAVIGPMNVCGFQLTDDVAPADARAEAQSWIQAAVYLGSAVGGALTGVIIEIVGARGAMFVGVLGVTLARTVLARSQALLALKLEGPRTTQVGLEGGI